MSDLDLSESITITGGLKKTGSNHESGERTIVIGCPQTEAAKVARLSIYDGVEFEITFKPVG